MTREEILENVFKVYHHTQYTDLHNNQMYAILKAMELYACQEVENALRVAAENAKLMCTNEPHPKGYPWLIVNPDGKEEKEDLYIQCNKKSILNAYKVE